jgi:hypothetical protein
VRNVHEVETLRGIDIDGPGKAFWPRSSRRHLVLGWLRAITVNGELKGLAITRATRLGAVDYPFGPGNRCPGGTILMRSKRIGAIVRGLGKREPSG